MPKRILVPLDRTAASEAVLPFVAGLARGEGASVRLLYVAPEPDNIVTDGRVVAYADQEMKRLETGALDYLDRVERQLPEIDVDSAVRFGEPADEIIGEAEAFGADLIAVTTSCRSGVTRALLGGVSERLIRKAAAAVMLLRPPR